MAFKPTQVAPIFKNQVSKRRCKSLIKYGFWILGQVIVHLGVLWESSAHWATSQRRKSKLLNHPVPHTVVQAQTLSWKSSRGLTCSEWATGELRLPISARLPKSFKRRSRLEGRGRARRVKNRCFSQDWLLQPPKKRKSKNHLIPWQSEGTVLLWPPKLHLRSKWVSIRKPVLISMMSLLEKS